VLDGLATSLGGDGSIETLVDVPTKGAVVGEDVTARRSSIVSSDVAARAEPNRLTACEPSD
jgi:hypothetical protein